MKEEIMLCNDCGIELKKRNLTVRCPACRNIIKKKLKKEFIAPSNKPNYKILKLQIPCGCGSKEAFEIDKLVVCWECRRYLPRNKVWK